MTAARYIHSLSIGNCTTATGLEEFRMERMELPTGTQFDLIEATTAATEDANYMYIINKNTDVTDYVIYP